MPEYDMPIEEQIKVLVKEFRTFKDSVETRFESIDTTLTTVDTKIDKEFAAATKTSGEHTGLLNSVLVHVRNRVDRVERPAVKGRRRL